MTDEQRAKDYIRIFIAAGDRWRDCVPVDGVLRGDRAVQIGAVELCDQGEGVWSLNDGNTVTRYQRARTA